MDSCWLKIDAPPAYTGISGRSTGPHVHYEVRMNNAPVNPWRYMKSTNPSGD